MQEARDFRGGALGPSAYEEHGLLRLHLASGRDTLVHERSDPTPAIVARGVRFGRYDGLEQDGEGSFREGGPCIAWFRDPSSVCCRSSKGASHEGARAAALPAHRLRPGR
jgi:hypothetical protein